MRISDWSSDVCSSDLTGSFNLRVDLPTEQSPAKLRENHGGVWGEYPEYPANDWRLEVENHDTRIGYWEWVAAKIEQAELERSEEHTSELQSLMRISYAVFCLKKKETTNSDSYKQSTTIHNTTI